MRERLLGFFLLAVGAFAAYFCIYEPLEASAQNAEKVSVSLKGSILCPIFLVLGLLYAILGPWATKIMGTREEPKPLAWVLGLGLLGAGILLYVWLRITLQNRGYEFHGL
jgi:hypothetical protein